MDDHIEGFAAAPIRKDPKLWSTWDIEANMHLRAYLGAAVPRDKARYLPKCWINPITTTVEFCDESKWRHNAFVALKNAWAEDMEADALKGGVPIIKQQEAWREVMTTAEGIIDQRIEELRRKT